jgi:hypothetical protein
MCSKKEKIKCVFKIDIISLKYFENAFLENKLIGNEEFSVLKLNKAIGFIEGEQRISF